MRALGAKKGRGLVLAAAVCAAGLVGGLCVFLYARFFATSQVRFIYSATRLDRTSYARLASAPGWTADEAEVSPGILLRGLVHRPVSSGASWILYYPGNDRTQLKTSQAFLSRLRGERDLGLAAYAYRGYDASDGVLDAVELRADAVRIVEHLIQSEHVAPGRIHVVGFSLGGYFATKAVDELMRRGTTVASLSLLASVGDVAMVKPSPWQRLDPGDAYVTSQLSHAIQGPLLLLQGDADEAFHGPDQGRALTAALGAEGRYEEVAGVGHEGLLEDEYALSELRAYMFGIRSSR